MPSKPARHASTSSVTVAAAAARSVGDVQPHVRAVGGHRAQLAEACGEIGAGVGANGQALQIGGLAHVAGLIGDVDVHTGEASPARRVQGYCR